QKSQPAESVDCLLRLSPCFTAGRHCDLQHLPRMLVPHSDPPAVPVVLDECANNARRYEWVRPAKFRETFHDAPLSAGPRYDLHKIVKLLERPVRVEGAAGEPRAEGIGLRVLHRILLPHAIPIEFPCLFE